MLGSMHGLIFAHQPMPGLRELVKRRTSASIPYGGRYRLIDFALSNMVNAGITDIGVIMQENYQSLLDHIGSGKDWDIARRVGGLRLLPPFSYTGNSVRGYRGRMEALAGLSTYIERVRQDYVVLCEGSLVANIPFREVLEKHKNSGADITAVCTVAGGVPSELDNYFICDENGFVKEVISHPGTELKLRCRSLEAYVMSTSLLQKLTDYCKNHSLYSFTIDVLQRMDELKVFAYIHNGYTAFMRTVSDYYNGSMELLKPQVRNELFMAERPVRTKERADPSTYYGSNSSAHQSLIADGCIIEGNVSNSILFRGVRIGKGASVKNCILMQDTVIENDVNLEYVITDKSVTVSSGCDMRGHGNYPITIMKGSMI